MNRGVPFSIFTLMFAILPVLFLSSKTFGAFELEVKSNLIIDVTPIDVAFSPDGRKLFVLTDRGSILVYTSGNTPTDKIEVGSHVDQIKVGPKGDVLVLSSRQKKTIQIVQLDFIQSINITGSPFKGPEDAAVVIAVFDDFQ
jgi:DNA-binding beta-propeller fold protein YncE